MIHSPKIICFGEILWDVFPDKKVIGGAPLNVALRLHSQGHSVGMISKIGQDAEGDKAMEYLEKQSFFTKGIQQDPEVKTGEVLVSINSKGSATYSITEPVAWDFIDANETAKSLVENSAIFIFGSLACRRPHSSETLFGLLKSARFSVFDVNLRPPYYSIELLVQLIKQSNLVKMNDEELQEITQALNGPISTLEESAAWLLKQLKVQAMCVTEGKQGAFLYYKGEFYKHSGFKVIVEDTVGAGDSFLATLIGELYIHQSHPALALQKACAMGALVASKPGANCTITNEEITSLKENTKN